ncbi:MAG: 30S ribosomal protein S8 [Candidatus Omnitrophica bacterium]|nr:30S ribosomal protein S8 [Candidatus Omnitrophota bacterium]
MSVTDPLADMFTVIRNASRAKIDKVEVPSSKLKLEILEVFKRTGYIKNYKSFKDQKQGTIRIYLKFNKEKKPAIRDIQRVSKPGLRVHLPKDKLPRVLRGMGLAVISTSLGLLTDEEARKQGVGGEVICQIS